MGGGGVGSGGGTVASQAVDGLGGDNTEGSGGQAGVAVGKQIAGQQIIWGSGRASAGASIQLARVCVRCVFRCIIIRQVGQAHDLRRATLIHPFAIRQIIGAARAIRNFQRVVDPETAGDIRHRAACAHARTAAASPVTDRIGGNKAGCRIDRGSAKTVA